jgi:hypothetical protein
VGLMQILSNHSGDLFDLFKGSVNGLHNAPQAVGDFFSQGLHFDKVPGLLKQVFDTNPTNAAHSLVDKMDRWANPDFYNIGGFLNKTGSEVTKHNETLKQLNTNLVDIAKTGGIALPAFIGERLAALGLRKGAKNAFNKATDVVSDKAAVKAVEQLNLVSAANDANLMERFSRMFGLNKNTPGEVKSAYATYSNGKMKV